MPPGPTAPGRRRPLVYSALPEGQGPVARPIQAMPGRKPRRGLVWMPTPAPSPIATLAPVHVARASGSRRGRPGGRVWMAAPAPSPAVVMPAAVKVAGASDRRRRARGRVWMPAHPAAVVATAVVLAPVKVAGSSPRRGRRAGRVLIVAPALPGGIGYHVYGNTGAGDPIDYTAIVATVLPPSLAYTTAPLSHPGTWSFGLRAFDLVTGFEEANLEAAVTIVLDANGVNITNRPAPPLTLGAFATANASIRVQWAYPPTSGPATPAGFHVYIGPVAGPLTPVSAIARGGFRAGSGSAWMSSGVGSPGRSARRASGLAIWRPGLGAAPNHGVAAATVGYQSAIAGSFVANLSGLANGVTYAIGVRAYNATAEEPNTNTVQVTATSTGPAAVASLAAAAVS